MRRFMAVLGFVMASRLLEAASFACPSCPTSRTVAAIVCGTDGWHYLARIMAPFPVMALVAWRLHGMGRRRAKARGISEG